MSYPVTSHILNELKVRDLSMLSSYSPRSQPHIGPRAVLKNGTVMRKAVSLYNLDSLDVTIQSIL